MSPDEFDFNAEIKKIRALTDRAVADLNLPPERPVRKAPALDMTPATTSCIVGALLRRELRRELMSVAEYGITFREEKGFLDSAFFIRGPRWAINNLNAALADAFRRLNS